ncbi:ATP-binding cassette subfamily C protein CydD [Novosphingobium sp. SG751A]|uniref:ATP-binding cassette domain-containing protein n=1 Tax=Novosphingobium sp. SG751A TaxID=2587000 RepID=UPI001557E8DF|nr:ATP-binding cassette domain-containing protein [Novosphingobium sp. SG751A]NOW45207.1 ATP-binding cassette subfamily C protein CydD [Novosphingobium sp. SG751A]
MDTVGAIVGAMGLAWVISGAVSRGIAGFAPFVLLAGGLIRALAQSQAHHTGIAAAIRAQTRWQAALLPALLPTRLMRDRLVGEDMHLAIEAPAATRGYVARYLPLRIASGVSPLLVMLAAWSASHVAATIMLATLAPFILGMVLAGSAAARRAQVQHQALERLSGLFIDRLRALPTILAFGAEERVSRHLGASARDAAKRTLSVLAIAFASGAILEFFAALCVALVAVYCGFSLLGLLPFPAPETLDLRRAFFVLALAPEFYLGLRRLASAYHEKQSGEAALSAMDEAMDALPAPVPVTAPPRRWTGQGVILTHREGAQIGPLNWDWHGPGLHAMTGPTGSGKSSLLLALIGQVPVGEGRITADGTDFLPGSANPCIGWAGQSVALLPGTLRDNLSMGMADDGAMLAVLERMGLGEMMVARGGLGMVIDHRASGLSGGERRRIGLARAILSRRPILLLDEPTADLDAATAATIRILLIEVAHTQMVITATHDADLIAQAATQCSIDPEIEQ